MHTTTLAPAFGFRSWHRRARQLRAALLDAWRARRATQLQEQHLRALAGLDDHMLRDIGMAERMPPPAPQPVLLEFGRGSW